MFERFTEEAREAIVLAQDEARSLRHGYVGTEHLLLGLLRQERSRIRRALDALGVAYAPTREDLIRVLGVGEEVEPLAPLTVRAQRALEVAWREARGLGLDHVEAEHLLLGAVRDPDSVASRILRQHGADSDGVRAALAEAR